MRHYCITFPKLLREEKSGQNSKNDTQPAAAALRSFLSTRRCTMQSDDPGSISRAARCQEFRDRLGILSKFRQALLLQILLQDPGHVAVIPGSALSHQREALFWSSGGDDTECISQCSPQHAEILAFPVDSRGAVQAFKNNAL